MLEVLQFYVSSFWIWLGLTCGLVIIVQGIANILHGLFGLYGRGK
ncbi:hypothetical protein [Ruixingdingia sedimenti]|uniref:Uncharacterized protein n=1 Tax=Ruixingdingia sedimenti TaxID=3073604 RepID=A0ABU1FF64_9RHOB|nr:hypothetical protein [Xinfangfangia sp. LG-4]MDR5655549.1 hypothetical protein [Xinfangfangia sp. LG-4]